MTDKSQKREIVLRAIQEARARHVTEIRNLTELINTTKKELEKHKYEMSVLDESIEEVNKVLRTIPEIVSVCSQTKPKKQYGAKITHNGNSVPKDIVDYIKSYILGQWRDQKDVRKMIMSQFDLTEWTAKPYVGWSLQYLREQPRLNTKTEKIGTSKRVMIPTVNPASADDINMFMENERKRAIELADTR